MSDAELHQRAKALFLKLLALPADTRDGVLERETAGDAALRAEVDSLLRYAPGLGAEASADPRDGKRRRFVPGDLFADRYRIIAQLGRGASGEVYRAFDTRLDVEIALKIVHTGSPPAVRRLLAEVRLARQVTHPAICRVYDVEEADGEHFLTMELVGGEDLASLLARVGRLSPDKVRELGIELLRGLAAAHAQGILHRDLKPSNVMIDEGGSVRITDFGIAALEEKAETAAFAGTPAFMAPEQLEDGAPASVQTDLYAVGLILYEALVGRLPATAPEEGPGGERAGDRLEDAKQSYRETATVAAQDRSVAAPHPERSVTSPSRLVADVDPGLDRLIVSLLARDPSARPHSASEAADALEAGAWARDAATRVPIRAKRRLWPWVSAAAVLIAAGALATWRSALLPKKPIWQQVIAAAGATHGSGAAAIAVLPVADESSEHDHSSVAQAVQRRIIERLESVRDVRVIAEESCDRFSADADVREVGRETGASLVARGRLFGSSGRPQLELALYDASSGRELWRESYASEVLASAPMNVDGRVVAEVFEALDVTPESPVRVTSLPMPANTDQRTYALYLRGSEHVPPYTETEFRSSVALLKQVVEQAPEWAEPHATIATAYITASTVGWISPAEGYPVARRYAERALALDASLCEAQVALALVAGDYEWDWERAEASYDKALELCPGSAWAHRNQARFLASQARIEEALAETTRALELDPTSPLMLQGAAQRFYEARRYERAVALARIAKQLDPLYPYTYVTLALALIELGQYPEALEALDRASKLTGRTAAGEARRAYAWARSGDMTAAKLAADSARQKGSLDAMDRSLVAMAENDDKAAVDALADAVAARAPPSIWLAVSPLYDSLRERDDFRALVARVGLPSPTPAP